MVCRGSRGGIACLGLLLAGCEATLPGEPGEPVIQAARSEDSRHVRIGRPFGVSDRMAYIGLADSLATTPKVPSPFRFTDILEGSGIDFVHVSGTTAERYFPTAFGSGVAMLDYDGDGRLDLYFATNTFLPPGTAETGPNKLYRNLGGGKFEDVTAKAGLDFAGFCHGIIVGDLDNDGDPDLFLCNVGPNALYLNNGDGTFRDISHSAGIDTAELVDGRGDARLRQRRRPGPLRRQLRRLRIPPDAQALRLRGRPALLLSRRRPVGQESPLPQRRRRDLHRRDRPGGARPRPTATASAPSRPTSTATAGSTSTPSTT